MITDTIGKQINEAMKSGDEVRLTTLRVLSTALHNAEIDKIGKLTEDEELAVVKREVKKRRDAIEIYDKAQDQEKAAPKAEKEKQELAILLTFLPEQMGDDELNKLIDEAIAQTGAATLADMGKVMGTIKDRVQGKADGGRIAELVKGKLLNNK